MSVMERCKRSYFRLIFFSSKSVFLLITLEILLYRSESPSKVRKQQNSKFYQKDKNS